jgi:NTP pyrophosphatase (non-canonical NTP hydrolase)
MNLKEIGKEGNKIEDEIGLDINDSLNKLTQELGEFNDAVQKFRGKYSKTKTENLEQIESEVGDLMFNIISICHRLGINPDELPAYAEKTLEKLKERKNLYLKNQKD